MLVLILARAASQRLPGKHFLDLGDTNVIDFVARRVEHFGFKAVIAVPRGEAAKFIRFTSCKVMEGDPDNVELRGLEVTRELGVNLYHLLDGDDPLFDPLAVLESLNLARQFRLSQVRPSSHSRGGSGRMGTTYNLDAPAGEVRNLMDALELPWPQRLTLDYAEDYALIRMAADAIGGYMAPRSAVDRLFVDNPDLHKINWFRNAQWKQRLEDEQRSGH